MTTGAGGGIGVFAIAGALTVFILGALILKIVWL